MGKTLEARLRTVAEIKLLDMDVQEFITEILSEYGEDRVEMEAARIGLSELLFNTSRPGEKGRKRGKNE